MLPRAVLAVWMAPLDAAWTVSHPAPHGRPRPAPALTAAGALVPLAASWSSGAGREGPGYSEQYKSLSHGHTPNTRRGAWHKAGACGFEMLMWPFTTFYKSPRQLIMPSLPHVETGLTVDPASPGMHHEQPPASSCSSAALSHRQPLAKKRRLPGGAGP